MTQRTVQIVSIVALVLWVLLAILANWTLGEVRSMVADIITGGLLLLVVLAIQRRVK